jgi:hypothetical protein
VLLSRFHKSQPNAAIFRVGRRAFAWTIHRSAHRPRLLSPHSSPQNGTANMLTNATDHLSIFSYLSQRQLPDFNVQQPRHHSPLSAALRRSRQLRFSEQKQYKLTTSCSTTDYPLPPLRLDAAVVGISSDKSTLSFTGHEIRMVLYDYCCSSFLSLSSLAMVTIFCHHELCRVALVNVAYLIPTYAASLFVAFRITPVTSVVVVVPLPLPAMHSLTLVAD